MDCKDCIFIILLLIISIEANLEQVQGVFIVFRNLSELKESCCCPWHTIDRYNKKAAELRNENLEEGLMLGLAIHLRREV